MVIELTKIEKGIGGVKMEEKSTYVDILIMSLKKKISILEKIEDIVFKEEELLKKKDVSLDEVEALQEEKEDELEELEKADDGFQKVYDRVREEFAENKSKYEDEIKTMQGMIKQITDSTTKIQAQEIRNKRMTELFFQQKKNEVKSFKLNHKSASTYTRHLADRTSGQSYFFDSTK